MSDLTDAIEAAALAMYGTPRLAERNRDMAERAINAAEAIIRADERTKVAEEVAQALLAVDPIEWALAGQSAGEDAAAIARTYAVRMPGAEHAANGPRIDVEAPTAHAEGHRMGDGSNGAQEAVG